MRRNVLAAIACVLIVVLFGFHLIVPTDSGVTRLDEVSGSDSLVVLIHGLAGPDSLAALKRVVRADFQNSDIMTATFAPSSFANINPYRVANTLEEGIHKAFEAKHYKSIVLVGHSLGAVLLPKALVWAHGAEGDPGAFTVHGRTAWPDKGTRFAPLPGAPRSLTLRPPPPRH